MRKRELQPARDMALTSSAWIDALGRRMSEKQKLITRAIRRRDYRTANDLAHEVNGMSDALTEYTSASIDPSSATETA